MPKLQINTLNYPITPDRRVEKGEREKKGGCYLIRPGYKIKGEHYLIRPSCRIEREYCLMRLNCRIDKKYCLIRPNCGIKEEYCLMRPGGRAEREEEGRHTTQ